MSTTNLSTNETLASSEDAYESALDIRALLKKDGKKFHTSDIQRRKDVQKCEEMLKIYSEISDATNTSLRHNANDQKKSIDKFNKRRATNLSDWETSLATRKTAFWATVDPFLTPQGTMVTDSKLDGTNREELQENVSTSSNHKSLDDWFEHLLSVQENLTADMSKALDELGQISSVPTPSRLSRHETSLGGTKGFEPSQQQPSEEMDWEIVPKTGPVDED